MGRLAVFATMALLAGWAGAQAQNSPTNQQQNNSTNQQKPPTDKAVVGVFTPDRLNGEQEAAARKRQEAGQPTLQRGRGYYFAWSSMTPQEFEALNRHVVFLFAIWTQKPEELPVKRIYVRADGQEAPLYKVASWKTAVDGGSLTAKMFGTNREDGFYLVPGDALLRKGEIALDLGNRSGWIMMELPSNVASADAKHFANATPAAGAKPNLRVLQDFVRRRYPGFPVPQSLP